MLFIRGIIFTITLAFGFCLSGHLRGIDTIRAGSHELVTSFSDSVESGALGNKLVTSFNDTVENGSLGNDDLSDLSKYINTQLLKIILILTGIFFALLRASIIGASIIGLVGGVMFSPEIATYPFMQQYADSISRAVIDFAGSTANSFF